ncbi:MAG: hypothetical protein KAW41_01265 [Candidatus Diapherotrites archaeon]|nr:hypothetical protein [Candidatus Diapherotrites archaeon]
MAKKKPRKKAKPRQSYGKPGAVPTALQTLLLLVAAATYAWFGVNLLLNPALLLDRVFATVIVLWGVALVVVGGFYLYKRK